MVEGPIIGVLTLSVGCDYFGSILGGIARTTAAAGGRMITIQTLGAGTFDFDPPEPPDFGHPIAWEHVSAFIVILNSASRSYLEAIRRAGKPVIMISDEMPGFSCPVVLPDNRTGVRQAVSHLVEHGHRDIAFAGYLELRDLRERHAAYRETLIECGIEPRADLYFDTGDNRDSGGERAARAMLAAGMPSTAVLTGNDLNAIGLMRTLLAAGLEVPREQAVVGFDDMDGVALLTPSLSTVRQRFAGLGHEAATLALRALAGEQVEARTWYVPTSFQPRESCGCPGTLAPGALPADRSRARPLEENEFLTTLKMMYTVSKNLLRSHEKDPRGLAWIQDTNARGGCLGLWSRPAGGARPALDVVTVFERDRGPVPAPDGPLAPQSFPPAGLVELADLDDDQMVYVAPLKIGPSDWGMLALVAPIEAHLVTGREMMNQWAALLTFALDHEAVLKSLREQEELLRHAALYDPLTGLANRTLFLERLEQAITSQAADPGRHYSVLLLDLDGFKLVNDSLGHLAGDRLLVRVAERIQASAQEADVAARFGGDEFAILLNDGPDGPDGRAPVAVAERIRAALEAPFRLGEEEVLVSASIGISLSTTGYQNAEDVIRDADTAMYSAKWQRKGSHAVFDIAMHDRVVGRLRTEAELRRALETGAFQLHYQPIVRLSDGTTRAFEALHDLGVRVHIDKQGY